MQRVVPAFSMMMALLLTAGMFGVANPPRFYKPGRPASNEVVAWVSRAALDANWEAAFQAAAKARPKQPVLKIPNDFDPDRG